MRVLIVFCLLIFFINCVPKSKKLEDKVSSEDGKITIVYWDMPHWRGYFGDALDQHEPFDQWQLRKIKEFELMHPDVKIKFLMIPWENERLKLELALTAGNPPDIAYMNAENLVRHVSADRLEPIDDYLTEEDKNDFLPEVLDEVKVNGKYYAWPWYIGSMAIAVNLDLFEERNALDLLPENEEKSWTWEEFLKAAKKLTFDRDGDGKIDVYGFGVFGGDNYYYLYDPFFASNGLVTQYNEDETKSSYSSPLAKETAHFLADLVFKHKVAPPGAVGIKYSDIYTMFLQQRIAMLPGGMWMIAAIPAQATKPFKYTFVQYPHNHDFKSYSNPTLATYVVFKQNNKKKKDLIMEFARYMTNTRNDIAVVGNTTFPVRRSCGFPYYGDDKFNVFKYYITHFIPYEKKPHSEERKNISKEFFQALLSGFKKPDEALKIYVEKMNKMLEKERQGKTKL